MNLPPQQLLYPTIRSRSELGWQLDHYEREMILGGDKIPQRQLFDLLQNCDLPPPLKVFPAPEKDEKPINTSRSVHPTLQSPPLPPPILSGLRRLDRLADELGPDQGEKTSNTSDLLKALRLSQTRAREAERRASDVGERNERMITLLLDDSVRLFAHRQWVKLLEFEISWLREEKQRRDDDDDDDVPSTPWSMSFTLCLGIMGVGFALGCRYLFW